MDVNNDVEINRNVKDLEKGVEKIYGVDEKNKIIEFEKDCLYYYSDGESEENVSKIHDTTEPQIITWESFFDSNESLEPVFQQVYHNKSFSETNYLKGLKWSPCGNQLLASSNDNHIRCFNLSVDQTLHRAHLELTSKCYEGEDIYDFAWYPVSTMHEPESCCFVTTSRGQPVHLWNPLCGEIRCSYRPYNAMDEMEGAISVSFDALGERIFCGSNNCVRVFHTSRPGRDFELRPTYVNKEGQNGLISCFAFSQSQAHTYACGSYAKTVSLCDDRSGEVVMVFSGHEGGVTHLAFSNDANTLFSGGRKDAEILCWDLRQPGHVLKALRRNVSTNQRIYFDLDPTGRYVVSGNHDGHLSLWDDHCPFEDKNNVKATTRTHAHNDTVTSVSFHPVYPILASGSGQRHFKLPDSYDDDDDSGDDDDIIDNSIKLWLLNLRKSQIA